MTQGGADGRTIYKKLSRDDDAATQPASRRPALDAANKRPLP
jgi:hypothetical protein